MLLSVPQTREPAPVQEHDPLSVSELRDVVRCARPGLPEDAPQSRAAVLLLLIPETGPNVDRLALRTGLPRAFVARCLRRLVDNAWWIEGEPPPYLRVDSVSNPEFWLDVEVALGRQLRRVGDDGRPEWARAGDWVKEFEYAGSEPSATPVYTAYREIARHDPEPVRTVVEVDADSPAGPGTAGMEASPRGRSAKPPPGLLIESWAHAEWLR